MLQRRMREVNAPPRVQRSLLHRGIFKDSLTWMEIHGQAPSVVEHWRGVIAQVQAERLAPSEGSEEPGDNVGNVVHPQPGEGPHPPGRRRRRRRRRRRTLG